MKKLKFIIVCPSYNDDSGGALVLHKLCDYLNRSGHRAFIWHLKKPVFTYRKPIQSIYKLIRFHAIKRPLLTNDHLTTPIASYKDIPGSIVVYPEIVFGNPLNASNVVRWILYHTPQKTIDSFNKNDLIFYYNEAYVIKNSQIENNCEILYLSNNREETYFQENFGERSGSCYLMRKGSNRKLVHDLTDSVKIDGLKHDEIAKIFNKVKYLFSYDNYTMYAIYAAMCGCIPIVIPYDNIQKDEWAPNVEDTYGIAYGINDINYAISTRTNLLNKLSSSNDKTISSINNFISICSRHLSQAAICNHSK